MKQSLRLNSLFSGARLRPVHAIVAAAALALVSAGCEETESTDSAVGADQGSTCHGAISSFEWVTRIGPTQDPVKGQCVPVELTWDMHYEVPCVIIEGRSVGAADAASCNACPGAGRVKVNPYSMSLVDQMKAENADADLDCFCAIEQVVPNDFSAPNALPCQMDPSDAPVDAKGNPLDGFCYLDPHHGLGDAALTESCPVDEKRLLRFVGDGAPAPSSITYVACVGESYTKAPVSCP